MKKYGYALLIMCCTLLITAGAAQNCGFLGINLTSQSQIDNFSANYPGCINVDGSVSIVQTVGQGAITNLNGLSQIRTIGGSLFITGTEITSVNGLNNITSITGDIVVSGNSNLSNLLGLDALTSIRSLRVQNSPAIEDIEGIEGITDITNLLLRDNPLLNDLTGLENVESIANLTFLNNASLSDVSALAALTDITGFVSVENNASLQNFIGFENLIIVGGPVEILSNASLSSVGGFDNVESIGGELKVHSNGSLLNFDGLSSLQQISGNLDIQDNLVLESLTGLLSLTAIDGFLFVFENPALSSLSGLDNIDANSIDAISGNDLILATNGLLETCAVQSICDFLNIPGRVYFIANNATGCNSDTEVSTECAIVPVIFSAFEARLINEKVVVMWSTSTEINNEEFVIERSDHGTHFYPIDTVVSAANNALETVNYSYDDYTFPIADNVYYRIKQIDLDGSVSYSNITQVNTSIASRQIKLYPNPTTQSLYVSLPAKDKANYYIISINGEVVKSGQLVQGVINVSNLAEGQYILKIEGWGEETFAVQ